MRRLLLALTLMTAVPAPAASPAVDAARRYRAEHGAEILRDYADLLAIPNVAADLPGLVRNAETLRDALRSRGVDARTVRHGDAPPVVFGTLDAPNATRTIGIYVHYDGQPVDAARWTATAPFEPALYTGPVEAGGRRRELPGPGDSIDPEWRLYARGAGDDKAPLHAIYTALDALAQAKIAPTSDVVFLFEGEEEVGSTHLHEYLEQLREPLSQVDLWLICDGPVHPSRRPQLVFGVRGYTGVEITVYGAERYLHSGHYGNWAPNPALELSRLLASMKNASGQVVVEGFHDTVEPLTDVERRQLAALPVPDEDLRRELGLARTEANNALLVERILLPSLNVRGIESATVGPTARNIIPTTATASIDIRLVRANDPEKMLDLIERHIEQQGYTIVRDDPDHATRLAHPRLARVDRQPGYPAVRTRMDLPELRPVIAAAEAAADEPVVLMPTLGGSLPLYLFTTMFDRPLVIVPIANHDDNQHAPDENIRIANLWYGIDLFAALLTM